ncbi:demethoxyubiquinone hydroxylase family protein [Azospirillum baldaniorum]|uniref:3-demethoxyubiquinol 3-hydroxylase n=1 Tax=Azospirillum baldaniorum TaxID=1064539 RepID=A0A9P1JSX6_9PROT|nr:demethoxyubiquinone hydroxylase family protein [Azospirillum baldaniorum]AWJ89093.1 demethoxyubiquinone hydroxylase family protein [Azospirillum baldaniorum]TWA80663.1 ubiquinone biosynthesis monooxygenase Coq7 [Azospirillum brasilense]CCC99129.1 putative Ubiquinone biosynthesis protein COQ7 [Azospirillum baldaniorum]
MTPLDATAATASAPSAIPSTGESPTPRPRPRGRLPGDPTPEQRLARIVRVDHAGEYGAKRIYEGQLSVMGRGRHAKTLRHMADQELEHLQYFEKQLVARQVRPTVLQPLWHVAGFLLGAGTAVMGERAAMACTVAVEQVIDGHYEAQLKHLGPEEEELKTSILKFQAEEVEHRDIGLLNGAEQAPAYPVLSAAIKAGTKAVIWVAERV